MLVAMMKTWSEFKSYMKKKIFVYRYENKSNSEIIINIAYTLEYLFLCFKYYYIIFKNSGLSTM